MKNGNEDRTRWKNTILVSLVALLAACLHMLPYWHAQASARDGYEFSGNLTVSPDYMQYRVWERQALREGPIVTNTFTTEPNRAHLPVFYYWAVGHVAHAIGAQPEAVYAWSGALFAMVLAALIWMFVVRYIAPGAMRWWAYGAIMFGGGLGGHIKMLESTPVLGQIDTVRRLLIDPATEWPVFEVYRSHYVFKALFDSHFLLLWIVALLAILAFARAIEHYTPGRAALAAIGISAMTLLHVYEGVTLWAIAAAALATAWKHPDERRAALRVLVWCTIAVGITYVALGSLYARSGLPLPQWRAVNILFSVLLIAFPISWWLMAIGLADFWRSAGPRERFLVAWAAACTIVTLSGPFYPYPDRGILTMPVPLLLIGALIYAAKYGTPRRLAALVAIAVFAALPTWQITRSWYFSRFRTDAPFIYLSPDHQAIRDVLVAQATPDDILLAEEGDLLWIAPTFPGRFYVGHFFLTVNFDAKQERLQRALAAPADSLAPLLAESGATWLLVSAEHDQSAIERTGQVTRVATGAPGSLYRVTPRVGMR